MKGFTGDELATKGRGEKRFAQRRPFFAASAPSPRVPKPSAPMLVIRAKSALCLVPRTLEEGVKVLVFWNGENAAFEGTITKVEGAPGTRHIAVEYSDGDFATAGARWIRAAVDDSFDESDWRVVDSDPQNGPGSVDWSWREVPDGACQFMHLHLHLEKHIELRMQRYLGPKHSRPSQYGRGTLEWGGMTHPHQRFGND